jgi:hypothetical protein
MAVLMPGRKRSNAVLLALLVLGCLLGSQAASLQTHHSDCNAARHCCGICHFSHSTFSPPSAEAGFQPPARHAGWHHRAEQRASERDPLLVVSASRAPPA